MITNVLPRFCESQCIFCLKKLRLFFVISPLIHH